MNRIEILKEHDKNINKIIARCSIQLDNYYEELRQESIFKLKLVALGLLIISNVVIALNI